MRHTMEIRELETEAEWQTAIPTIQQLWTEEDGYRLFGLYVDEILVVWSGIPSSACFTMQSTCGTRSRY